MLWDIDRTLLYVGNIDRQVHREAFAEVVDRRADHLPARRTGVTMPLAIRGLLLENRLPEGDVPGLASRMVELLPTTFRAGSNTLIHCKPLASQAEDVRREGVLMPGAISALQAVHDHPTWYRPP